MRLKRLSIQRGRCISDVSIEGVSGGVFLTGGNASGKTSTLEGLQLLLYGWSPRTDYSNGARLGNGAASYVQDGQKNAIIEAEFDVGEHNLLLVQQIGGKAEFRAFVDGERTDMDRLDVWKSLGFDPRHAALCGLPAQFLDPKSSDDITKLLAGGIDADALYKSVGEYASWLREFVGDHALVPQTAADWYAIGDAAYAARTKAKAQLKELDVELEAFVPNPVEDGRKLTPDDFEEIKARLERLRQEHRELLLELGAAQAGGRTEQAIAADLKRAEAALTKAADKYTAAKAEMEVAQANLADLQEQQRKLMAEEGAARHKMHAAERRAEQAAQALEVDQSTCPTCHQAIPEETQARRRAELTTAAENAAAEAQMAAEAYMEIRNSTESLQAEIDEGKRALRKAQDTYGAAHGAWQACVEKARELRAEKPLGRPVKDIEAEVAAKEAAVKQSEELLTRLHRLAARDAMEKRRKELSREIVRLEWAVEGFKNGAVIKRFIGAGGNAFAARVNQELEPFGYEMSLEVRGKALDIKLGRMGTSLWPVQACSEGERWLAQFAIAMAFAEGAPIILDDVNHLDGKHKDKVRRRLRTYDGTLIVAGAWSKPSEPDLEAMRKAFAPATFVWMERGVATVLHEQDVAA